MFRKSKQTSVSTGQRRKRTVIFGLSVGLDSGVYCSCSGTLLTSTVSEHACCIHKHKEETSTSFGGKLSNDRCCIHWDKDNMLHSSSASICNGIQDPCGMGHSLNAGCGAWSRLCFITICTHNSLPASAESWSERFEAQTDARMCSRSWNGGTGDNTACRHRGHRVDSQHLFWLYGQFVCTFQYSLYSHRHESAAFLSAVCVKKVWKKQKIKLRHDIWGSRWQNVSHRKETKGPFVWLVYSPCWSRTMMLTFFFLPLSPGSLKFCSVTSPSPSLQSDSLESDVSLSPSELLPDSLSSTSATSWGHGDKITRPVKDALKAAKWRKTD